MIEIMAQGTLKPGCGETFEQLAHELVEKTRQEPGCISYQLCKDLSDSNTYAFLETWQDSSAIYAHNQTSHFTSIVPRFESLFTGPMEVKHYKIIE